MPRAYYQCPMCKTLFSTRYSFYDTRRPPEVRCFCTGQKTPTIMTYRGDGWEGRENIPHKGEAAP